MSPLCSAAGSPDPRMDLVHVSESRRGGRRSAQSEGQPSADGFIKDQLLAGSHRRHRPCSTPVLQAACLLLLCLLFTVCSTHETQLCQQHVLVLIRHNMSLPRLRPVLESVRPSCTPRYDYHGFRRRIVSDLVGTICTSPSGSSASIRLKMASGSVTQLFVEVLYK